MNSADAMEGQTWSVAVFGRHAEVDPVIDLASVDAIQVPTSAGGTTIFSQSNAEIEMEQESDSIVGVLTVQPRDGLHYRLKAGQIRDFELEFSSGSQTNRLESFKDGFVWGLALGDNITQGTIVSAAIAWELSYTGSVVTLDRFQAASVTATSDIRLEQDEFQGLVNVSRRWKKVEPFAGLKLTRMITRMKDNETKERVSGTVDGVSPFAGVQFELANREFLVVEASFVDEESISAGLKVQF